MNTPVFIKNESKDKITERRPDMAKMNTLTIDTGGQWEQAKWVIAFDHLSTALGGGEHCKHCTSHDDETIADSKKRWRCPRIVVGFNQNGYNSTGICLDCILDAVVKHGLDTDKRSQK